MRSRGNLLRYGVYAAVFLIMFALTCLTPMIADDYSYCFSWADNSRIHTLGQIVSSMAVHRVQTNGRIFTHGLVQLLLIRPKFIFDLLNALQAVLLLALFERHFKSLAPGCRALLLLCAALLLWVVTPVFGQVFLWLDGSVNYGWGIALMLLFLRPYAARWEDKESRLARWQIPFFLLLAFLVGTWSESGAPAVLFMALCLLLLNARRDKELDWVLLLGLLFELAGFLFLMSAPATQGRAGGVQDLSSLVGGVQEVLRLAKESLLPLYLLYALSLTAALTAGVDIHRLLLSILFVLGGLCSLAAYSFAAYCAYRHLCFASCFTILAELLVLAELLARGRNLLPRLVAAGLAVFFVFQFPLGLIDVGVTYRHSLQRKAAVQAALDAGKREVVLEIYVPATKYSAPYKLEDLYFEPDVWPNFSLASYFGLDSVRGVMPAEKEAAP